MKLTYQKELDKIKEIIKNKPRGCTIKEISEKISINRNVVAKYLDLLHIEGFVDVEKFGRSKVYFPSKSIPISAMFDFSYEFIIIVNENMHIVEINTPLINYLGLLEKDKVIGKNIHTLSLTKSYPKMMDTILEVLQKKEIIEDKMKHTVKEGKKSDRFHIKFVPTTFHNGELGVTVLMTKIIGE